MKKQKIAGLVLGLLHISSAYGSAIFYPPYGNGKNYLGSYSAPQGGVTFTNNASNVLQAINQSSAPQQWAINYVKGGSGTGTFDAQIAGDTGVSGAVLNADNSIGVVGSGVAGPLVAQFNANGSLNSNLVFCQSIVSYVGLGALTKQEFSAIVSDGSGGYYVSGRVQSGANYGLVMHIINTGWLEVDTMFGNSGAGAYTFTITTLSAGGFSAIGRQSTGNIIVAGSYINGGTNKIYVARLLPNGTLDSTFTVFSAALTTMNNVLQLCIDSQDRILTLSSNTGTKVIARFNANGGLDTTFNAGTGYVTFSTANDFGGLTVLSNDSVIAVGSKIVNGDGQFFVTKYTSAGILDTTFNGSGVVTQRMLAGSIGENAQRVTVTPLGQIAAAGRIMPAAGHYQTGVLLLDAYGVPVSTFFNVGYTVQTINNAIDYQGTASCLYQTMTGTTGSSGLAIIGDGGGNAENIYFANPV